jgi:hypothetical protein
VSDCERRAEKTGRWKRRTRAGFVVVGSAHGGCLRGVSRVQASAESLDGTRPRSVSQHLMFTVAAQQLVHARHDVRGLPTSRDSAAVLGRVLVLQSTPPLLRAPSATWTRPARRSRVALVVGNSKISKNGKSETLRALTPRLAARAEPHGPAVSPDTWRPLTSRIRRRPAVSARESTHVGAIPPSSPFVMSAVRARGLSRIFVRHRWRAARGIVER